MSRKKFIYLVNLFLLLTINLISGYYNFGSNQNYKNSYINVNFYPECKKNFTYTNRQKNKCDISDLYRYLEDSDRPESNRFISRLNSMYFDFMNRSEFIKPIRNILNGYKDFTYHEFISQFGQYQYYIAFDEHRTRAIIRREADFLPGIEDFIDLNNYPRINETGINNLAVSHSLKIMGYQIFLTTGYCLMRFKYLNGTDLKDVMPMNAQTEYAFVFNDAGFIYSKYPFKHHPNGSLYEDTSAPSLFYHKFGTNPFSDREIFRSHLLKEGDVTAKLSDDGNYLIIRLEMFENSTTSYYFWNITNVRDINHYIHAQHLIGKFDANYEFCFTIGDFAVFFVKKFGMKSRVVVTKIQNSDYTVDDAELILKEEEGLQIKNVYSVGKDFFVIIVVKKLHNYLKLYNKKALTLVKDFYVGPGVIEQAQSHISHSTLIFSYNSIHIPNAIYTINFENVLNKGVDEAKKGTFFIAEFFKLSVFDFIIETEYYKSKDGKNISMIMFHTRDLKKNQQNPVIIEAYGDLSAAWHPQKSLAKLFFAKEFGGIWCIPGIRGIEGLGEKWTSDGIELKRKNSFDDFIYAIKHLIKKKYTTSSKIAIYGKHNGGLLTTVVSQREPKLIGAVVAKSPLLDTIRYDKLTKYGLAFQYGYGNLNKKKEFVNLYSFSPYHQMEKCRTFKKEWPSTLIIHPFEEFTNLVGHTTKYLAKLYPLLKKNPKSRFANPMIAYIRKEDDHDDDMYNYDKKLAELEMDELHRMLIFIQLALDLKFEK
ncbi:Prolyl endopeptidase [Strongyloides ratti]|uniref:Prolyl endopeptidase n=1 Tax=Strongyloides ratti TaxID=34506 RepID=A0A090KXF4_STRRB|nr:Prolyl endopeptidase [Strongyloides ratti]CEF59942.2 Prolyl endopeptidase [Strongyloides ratti]